MSQNSGNKLWFKSKIIKGKGIAKTFGYPTVNLHNPEILKGEKEGVYLCEVRISGAIFNGLLYYGPRLVLKENKLIVEIYILEFNKDIYEEDIEYRLKDFIRGVLDFKNFEDLKTQIDKDFAQAKNLIK